MCKHLVIILAYLALVQTAFASRKRAFFVGISHYDIPLTSYQWNDINGENDVTLLTPTLRNQGFICSTLTGEKATYKNIINGIEKLVATTKKGDIIYLHFSTHGQPIEDKNGDETDGWDEALIPIDAFKLYKKGRYEGEKHITDDVLSKWTSILRRKIGENGALYVVIDACHAGTSSRGEDLPIRGTIMGFTSDKSKTYNPPIEKKNYYHIVSGEGLSNVLFVEACRADQINSEIKINDKFYGALSYSLHKALQDYKISSDIRGLVNTIKATIRNNKFWPNNQNIVFETDLAL